MVISNPPHLKLVASLLCNLSLIACFLTIMFHRVVWQRMQGVVGFSIKTAAHLLRNLSVKNLWKSVKMWQNYDHVASLFFGPRVAYAYFSVIRRFCVVARASRSLLRGCAVLSLGHNTRTKLVSWTRHASGTVHTGISRAMWTHPSLEIICSELEFSSVQCIG